MDALSLIDDWRVGTTAAAVIGVDGVRATYGPTRQPFPLASVTKPLTALATLVAVEEGAVGLDDQAGPQGATVRHLLSHASGLAPHDSTSVAPPATRRIYSNAGFEVLAHYLSAATGMDFRDYFTQAVCETLGLVDTHLSGSPAHGATSTVADLARLASELLVPRLLHPATLREASHVAFPGLPGVLPGFGSQPDNAWGLGFEIRNSKAPHWTGSLNSPATFGHFGRAGTFIWVDPEATLACVVLTDTAFGPWAAQAWPALSDQILRVGH